MYILKSFMILQTKDHKVTPVVYCAALAGHESCVKCLLESGADHTRTCSEGNTLLHVAAEK